MTDKQIEQIKSYLYNKGEQLVSIQSKNNLLIAESRNKDGGAMLYSIVIIDDNIALKEDANLFNIYFS